MLFFSIVVFNFSVNNLEHVLKKLVVVAAVVFSGVALAADYPADVQGSWVAATNKDPKACNDPMLSIQKSTRFNDVDASCSVSKVTGGNGNYVFLEQCGREDAGWKQQATVSVSGEQMTVTERSKYQGTSTFTYRRCGVTGSARAADGAAVAAGNSAKVLTCRVNEGQAGVTTFLDEKMKKGGTSVRDFDPYEFKAEKKLTVNKTELYQGSLRTGEGKVVEARSYILAEEWNCK